MTAYYNEIDPHAAQWLRNLIDAGHIAPGIVDERSIEDVYPSDLRGFTQCHFFAGCGVWSYALRQAGWSDDRPVWTGSCPCQPFSAAGKGAGFDDERHLWPAFHHLIKECKPVVVFGEQVASKDGLTWIDLVLSDLEAQGYAAGAVDTCSAGFGAPHIRQRLYWVAHPQQHHRGSQAAPANNGQQEANRPADWTGGRGVPLGGMANTESGGWARELLRAGAGLQAHRIAQNSDAGDKWPGPTNGYWRDADWLGCRDGKWRPVEPSTFPLAYGAAARVVRLRAYGNAINAQAAQAFVECLI